MRGFRRRDGNAFMNAFRSKGGKGGEWEFLLQGCTLSLSDEHGVDKENMNVKEDGVRARS